LWTAQGGWSWDTRPIVQDGVSGGEGVRVTQEDSPLLNNPTLYPSLTSLGSKDLWFDSLELGHAPNHWSPQFLASGYVIDRAFNDWNRGENISTGTP
jgi:hypothetical protein